MSDDDTPPSFASPEQEIKHWKSKVADMQDALRETESSLQDFMESSKELEAEMEREISSSNKTISDLQRKNEILKGDVDEWKTKYQKTLAEHNKALSSMNKELTTLRDSHNAYKAKLRDMELDNDELENAERMISSSLADMELRYNKSLERTALLEEELVEKSKLEEENQRLKDELRDLNEEVAILRDTVHRSRVPSRADTHSDKNPTDEMTLADLMPSSSSSSASVSRRKERPTSYTAERPSSRQSMATPGSATSARPGFSQRVAGIREHSRRSSRDVRELLQTPASTIEESPDTLGRSRSTRALAARDSIGGPASPSAKAALRATVRASARPTVSSRAGAGGSMKMMQDMMARMRTLEARINSARNISRVPYTEESSIPRPSSRLGSSIGAGGYSSPVLSQSARASGRPSFDGKATIGSSIPVPTNGLSKSTSRRPSSRLSDRGTPPMPNVGLPRSTTPSGHLSTPQTSSRGPSPLEYLDRDPASMYRYGSGASSRRRSSVSALSSSTSAAGSTAKSRPSVSAATAARHAAAQDAAARTGGPPSSWKDRRARSGSLAGGSSSPTE